MMQFCLYNVYYGITFALTSITQDPEKIYKLAAFVSVAEIMSYLFTLASLKYPRKNIFFCSFIVTFFIGLLYFFDVSDTSTVFLTMIMKFFTTIAFSLMLIYATELFPVSVKSLGTGLV